MNKGNGSGMLEGVTWVSYGRWFIWFIRRSHIHYLIFSQESSKVVLSHPMTSLRIYSLVSGTSRT